MLGNIPINIYYLEIFLILIKHISQLFTNRTIWTVLKMQHVKQLQ